ncbi:unnamed protein product [Linum tenue]|uniref:Pentatricopeptide repeat-containing protein n=1 Tax=Linum tenue TaxID=586396 RepID=A0AAV0GWW0_9ROSI|nr:unnamed protein product [Linum tenue]
MCYRPSLGVAPLCASVAILLRWITMLARVKEGPVMVLIAEPRTRQRRRNPWRGLLVPNPGQLRSRPSLSTISSSISKTTVMEVLRLVKNPSNALEFFNWVPKMGFTHDQDCYFSMLEILGRAGKLNAARNFLSSIEKKSKAL